MQKKYSPDRIFNVNEPGLLIVKTKLLAVIGKNGKRQNEDSTATEHGLWFIVARVQAETT